MPATKYVEIWKKKQYISSNKKKAELILIELTVVTKTRIWQVSMYLFFENLVIFKYFNGYREQTDIYVSLKHIICSLLKNLCILTIYNMVSCGLSQGWSLSLLHKENFFHIRSPSFPLLLESLTAFYQSTFQTLTAKELTVHPSHTEFSRLLKCTVKKMEKNLI